MDAPALKLGKKIGEGGMGKVYLSTYLVDRDTGETINSATKTVPEKKMNLEEVVLQAKLSKLPHCHEHIACFYDLFQNPKTLEYYIVMEHIAGEDFWDYVNKHKQEFSFEELAKLFEDAMEGLSFIHAHDIAHGDVKLENFMINPNTQKLKYIDFGFGCTADSCAGNNWHGTPFLFPPEAFPQRRPQNLKDMKAADLWALGALLTDLIIYQPRKFKRIDDIGMSGADVRNKPKTWLASNFLKKAGLKRSSSSFDPFYKAIDSLMRIDPADRTPVATVLRTFKKDIEKQQKKLS